MVNSWGLLTRNCWRFWFVDFRPLGWGSLAIGTTIPRVSTLTPKGLTRMKSTDWLDVKTMKSLSLYIVNSVKMHFKVSSLNFSCSLAWFYYRRTSTLILKEAFKTRRSCYATIVCILFVFNITPQTIDVIWMFNSTSIVMDVLNVIKSHLLPSKCIKSCPFIMMYKWSPLYVLSYNCLKCGTFPTIYKIGHCLMYLIIFIRSFDE